MKKLLLSLSVVATMVACSTKEKTDAGREMVILQDSSALYQNNINTDKAAIVQDEESQANQTVTQKKYVNTNTVRRNTRRPEPRYQAPVQQPQAPPVVTTPPVATPPATETASGSNTTVGKTGTGTTEGTGTETTAETQKKTGISKAAKGAVIGAGAGAVAGAILGKSAKGAIIGAVLGAGGGYVLGRKQDKKDGRIE